MSSFWSNGDSSLAMFERGLLSEKGDKEKRERRRCEKRKNGRTGHQRLDTIRGEWHFFTIHLQKRAGTLGEVCILQIQAAVLLHVLPLSLLTQQSFLTFFYLPCFPSVSVEKLYTFRSAFPILSASESSALWNRWDTRNPSAEVKDHLTSVLSVPNSNGWLEMIQSSHKLSLTAKQRKVLLCRGCLGD